MTPTPPRRARRRTVPGLLAAALLAGLAAGCAPAVSASGRGVSTGSSLETVSEGSAAWCQPPRLPRPAPGQAAFLWTSRRVINQGGVVTSPRPAARPSFADQDVRVLTWHWDSARWHIVRASAAIITVPGHHVCNGGPAGYSHAPGFPLSVYASTLPGEALQWVRVVFARGPETASALRALQARKLLSNEYMTCTSHSCTGGLHMAYGYTYKVHYCPAPRSSGSAAWNARTGGSGVLAARPVLLSRHDWHGDIWHAYQTVGWPLPSWAVLHGGRYAVWAGAVGPPDCIIGQPHIEHAYGRVYLAVNLPRGVTTSGTAGPGQPSTLQWVSAYVSSK